MATVEVASSPTTRTDPDAPVEAKYWLHPKQQEAMALLGLDERWEQPYGWAVEEMLYGGQAGGGKSLLARCVALTLAHLWPNSRVPIFRRTYPELEETHIVKVQEEWYGLGRYHGGTHEWRWHNGSVTPFRHCEREADVFRYLSAEWDGLIVDEATQFSEYQISMLRSRVRSTRVRWRPVILYTANPGGVGHVFFKDGFVDAAPEGTLFDAPKDKGGLRRVFLRARLRDNPSLNAEQYAAILGGISDPEMRRAVADGDWDIFSGQFFKLWSRERHVVAPFDFPPSWHRRYVSVDWGYGAPWCTLFFARDEDLWKRDRIPRWYGYREFYAPGVRDQQQARFVRDAMEDDRASRAVVSAGGQRISPSPLVWDCVADPSMWTTSSQTGVSPADIYQAAGVPLLPANNDRVNGWQRVQEYLDVMEDGLPGVRFFSTCANTIRTLPVQQHARHRPEDLDTDGEDHAADALRYWAMTQSGITRSEGSAGTSSGYGLRGQGTTPPQGGQNASTERMFEKQLARASDPALVGGNKGGIVRRS